MKKRIAEKREWLWMLNGFLTALVPPLGWIALVFLVRSELKRHKSGEYHMNGVGQAVMLFDLLECILTTAILGGDLSQGVWIVLLFFLSGALAGFYMVLFAAWLRRQDRLHKVLHTVIHTSHITQADRMASVMAVNQDVIRKAFCRMIRWGVLAQAQFSFEQNKLLLPEEKWADAKVICEGCGAELIINIGQTLVCPYCKTAL